MRRPLLVLPVTRGKFELSDHSVSLLINLVPLSLGHPGALVLFLLLLAQILPPLQTHGVHVLGPRGAAAAGQALLVLRQPQLEALQRRGVLLGGGVRLLFKVILGLLEV